MVKQKIGARVIQFTYHYGHQERHEDDSGNGYMSPRIKAVGTKNFVVEEGWDVMIDMLWTWIEDYHVRDDPMFERVSAVDLDLDIAGFFKKPQYYLKDA